MNKVLLCILCVFLCLGCGEEDEYGVLDEGYWWSDTDGETYEFWKDGPFIWSSPQEGIQQKTGTWKVRNGVIQLMFDDSGERVDIRYRINDMGTESMTDDTLYLYKDVQDGDSNKPKAFHRSWRI